MSDVLATDAELEALRKAAGIPHLPTQLTFEARLAISGEGPRAYDWSDKPHRIVFDLCREIERAEAERDEAYARGYSDAETEISKSALGQRNAFLHEQYANAADRISALTTALWDILACETPNANATVTRMVAIAKAALKGESRD